MISIRSISIELRLTKVSSARILESSARSGLTLAARSTRLTRLKVHGHLGNARGNIETSRAFDADRL